MKVIVATTLLISVCSMGLAPTQPPLPQDVWNNPNAVPVESARVDINKQIEISVDVSGTLITLEPAERGGIVKKGQVVIEIDKEVPEKELLELEHKAKSTVLIDFARITLAEEELTLKDYLDRNKKAPGVFTDNEIRQQELAIEKAKAELKKATEEKVGAGMVADIKRSQIKGYTRVAEFDGIVTDLHKKAVGASIRQHDPIMTIVNLEEMLVTLTIHPRYEDRINVGDKVLVRRLALNKRATPSRNRDTGFGTSAIQQEREALPVALPQKQQIFEGRVTFTAVRRKADADNRLQIEAVVKNELVGTARYLLNEGADVEAIVIPQ